MGFPNRLAAFCAARRAFVLAATLPLMLILLLISMPRDSLPLLLAAVMVCAALWAPPWRRATTWCIALALLSILAPHLALAQPQAVPAGDTSAVLQQWLQNILTAVEAIAAPCAVVLAKWGLDALDRRFRLHVDAKTAARVEQAVSTGVGLLIADLAAGRLRPPAIHLGSPEVAAAVNVALGVAGTALTQAGETRDTLTAQVVAAVGHALGQDPTVPTVPPDQAAPAPAAAH